MLRFAANISTMFCEHPFVDRIAAAASVGFGAVECQWPYNNDPEVVRKELADAGISMVLMNAPCGDFTRGEIGIAALPGREHEFRKTIEESVNYARCIGCRQIHILAGIPVDGEDHATCRSVFTRNIQWAADQYDDHDLQFVIEAINQIDQPRYHLHGTADAVSAIKSIGRRNVGLQYDVYHSYRMAENVSEIMLEFLNVISHMQVSGYPNRHEPEEGEIPYSDIFTLMKTCDYTGWVGCEYVPRTTTRRGLTWAAEFGISS